MYMLDKKNTSAQNIIQNLRYLSMISMESILFSSIFVIAIASRTHNRG